MAVECEQFLFAAPPKAGCRFVHDIVRELGQIGTDNNLHTPVWKPEKPTVSIVRNPADWLRSYYTNINSPIGWDSVDSFLGISRGEKEPTNNGLWKFIEAYLEGPPGTVGAMFESYRPSLAWRIEDMPNPLEEWLGQKVAMPDKHESRMRLTLPSSLRTAIREHEQNFVTKWSY